LLRALEVHSILDCAEMAARASLFRRESRWGLYHYRVDHPARDDSDWFVHCMLYRDEEGRMRSRKRPVDPYVVEVQPHEQDTYRRLRVQNAAIA
jgi:succinate dehydrogenase/fumarate reductase flavoprotein subunit